MLVAGVDGLVVSRLKVEGSILTLFVVVVVVFFALAIL